MKEVRSALAVGVVALTLAVAACEASAPPPSKPAVNAAAHPSRIVSIVPAVTEMLFAIGAGPQVVGVQQLRHVAARGPLAAQGRRAARPGHRADHPAAADLVVVYGSQDDLRTQLERVGIRTFSYTLGGLDNVTGTMRRLGTLVGREREAEAAAARSSGAWRW